MAPSEAGNGQFVPVHPDDLLPGDVVQFEYIERPTVAGWPSANRTVKGTVQGTSNRFNLVVDTAVAGNVKLVTAPRGDVIVSTVVRRIEGTTGVRGPHRRGWFRRN